MTFEEVLAQVVDVLQHEERISYRALQRRFDLEDAFLEDLKVELIEAKQLARDENGRILVWTGNPLPAVAPTIDHGGLPGSLLTMQLPSDAAVVAPRAPEAERRQLTVLFCDLADSTRLARQLDPEDLRAVIRTYQATCVAVIQRFAGYVAQYLGDGLLVYFGYPKAHEDDARRAVRAGLGIMEAMGTLSTPLMLETSVRLAVRVGIHTGIVVVGEMGSGGRHEHLALGDTPNLAARLEGLAVPNTVVISESTSRLVRGYFICHDLGAQTLKGFETPVHACEVLGESMAQSRLEAAEATGFTPLVGRETEVTLLRERWARSNEGLGQVVVLTGEAGIGKSRLVRALTEEVIDAHTPRQMLRCSPYHTNSAFYPVIEHLHRLLEWHREVTADTRVAMLEQALQTAGLPLAEVVPLLAALLSLPVPDRYLALSVSPQRQKQQTQEALVAWMLSEAAQQPVLAIWEDLHWADPSTLELLGLLQEQAPTARLLLVLTARPEFRPPWGPRSYVTPLTLTRLIRPQVEQLILRMTGGKPLPAEVLRQIVEKTDGIPLFVEELVKTILESDLVREETERYVLTGPLPPLAIPTTLHDALMARLDRLAPVKAVAQLGAVLGREFSYALMRAVTSLDETLLQEALARLVEAELLYQRGVPPQATYLFKHALIQEAAYQSLLKSRRQQCHQQIAEVLEARFSAIVATQPELVAQHYAAAGCVEQAIPYWQRAGQLASDRSAYLEAISHMTTGITLLTTLPETPERIQLAVTLNMALGVALQISKGYAAPEVELAYTRAYALCKRVGESPELVQVLHGLWKFYHVGAQFHTARELGETLLRLAQRANDPALSVVAHLSLGFTSGCLGLLPAARAHFEESIAHDTQDLRRDPLFRAGQDPGVACRAYVAWTHWLLGYPEQALARVHEALKLAHDLSHAFSLAYARCWVATVSQLCRDVPGAHEHADAA
ncbi:MAG: adenylate/guanylate cyclase domain-containing protein, partial [Pseudomonadota bacterium]